MYNLCQREGYTFYLHNSLLLLSVVQMVNQGWAPHLAENLFWIFLGGEGEKPYLQQSGRSGHLRSQRGGFKFVRNKGAAKKNLTTCSTTDSTASSQLERISHYIKFTSTCIGFGILLTKLNLGLQLPVTLRLLLPDIIIKGMQFLEVSSRSGEYHHHWIHFEWTTGHTQKRSCFYYVGSCTVCCTGYKAAPAAQRCEGPGSEKTWEPRLQTLKFLVFMFSSTEVLIVWSSQYVT